MTNRSKRRARAVEHTASGSSDAALRARRSPFIEARRRTVAGAHRGVVRRYGHVHARRRACPIRRTSRGTTTRRATGRPRSCRSRARAAGAAGVAAPGRRRVTAHARLAAAGTARRRAAVARALVRARGEVVPGGVLRAARRGRHDAPRAARRKIRRPSGAHLGGVADRHAARDGGAPGGAGGCVSVSVRAQLPSRARARRGPRLAKPRAARLRVRVLGRDARVLRHHARECARRQWQARRAPMRETPAARSGACSSCPRSSSPGGATPPRARCSRTPT